MGLSSSFDRIGITDNPNPRTDQTTFQNALSSTFLLERQKRRKPLFLLGFICCIFTTHWRSSLIPQKLILIDNDYQ